MASAAWRRLWRCAAWAAQQRYLSAPEIYEIGAAFSIFSNAEKALRTMGLEDWVLSLAPELTRVSFLSPLVNRLSRCAPIGAPIY